MKVHYIGYRSAHDEWRDSKEIETPEEQETRPSVLQIEKYQPLDMH